MRFRVVQQYGKMRHTDHLSFAKMNEGQIGVGRVADPDANVFDRLYLGSKTQSRTPARKAVGRMEMAGDIAFKSGDAEDAVNLYTKVINERPNTFLLEKRCAA